MLNYEDEIIEKYGLVVKRVQAAKILTISLPTLDRLVKDQKIKATKVGHKVVFMPRDIVAFLGV